MIWSKGIFHVVSPGIQSFPTHSDDAQISFTFSTPWSTDDILTTIFRPIRVPRYLTHEQFIKIRTSLRETLDKLHFSQEQMRVYTMWLKYMATGPRVKELQTESQLKSRIKIVNELREWIKNHLLARDSRVLLPFSPEGVGMGDSATREKILDYELEPSALLKKVVFLEAHLN